MSQSIHFICHCCAGKWKIGSSLGRDFSGIENEDGIAKKNSKPGVFAKGSRMKDVNWIAKMTKGKTTTYTAVTSFTSSTRTSIQSWRVG